MGKIDPVHRYGSVITQVIGIQQDFRCTLQGFLHVEHGLVLETVILEKEETVACFFRH